MTTITSIKENIIEVLRDEKARVFQIDEQYLNEIGTSYAIKTVYYNWALESCSKHWKQILNRPNDYKFYYDIFYLPSGK